MQYSSLEVREIGRFLRSRREGADPTTFKRLPLRRRHVPYLTQADLAELAGISPVVVSQIEQAKYPNLNPSLLKRLAGALELPIDHQAYMIGLLNIEQPSAPRSDVPEWLRSATSETAHPVTVINGCFDILAWNTSATKILGDLSRMPPAQRNVVYALFCSPDMEAMMVEIDRYRMNVISAMKMWFAMYPAYRRRLLQLANDIEEQSEAFQVAWDTADPFRKINLEKQLNHPELGILNVYEIVGDILGEEGLAKIEFLPADDATREKMRGL